MEFVPAVAPAAEPTSVAWSFAFVEGRLLLPDGDEVLIPGPPIEADVRHYLGRLGGLDAWALRVQAPPPDRGGCRCGPR